MKKPTIEVSNEGPYKVSNLESFENSKGEKIPTNPAIALCRCGGSKNKPFCDGTHIKIGFSGKNMSDGRKDKRDNYVGKKITIHDNRGICAHSGFCTDNLSFVFKLKEEPWIDPDGATVEEVIETVKKCPSGALSFTIDNVEHRDQDKEPKVTVSRDGPYFVVGSIELKNGHRFEGTSKEHYTMCRCGGSKNKPFCDGTHWYIKFKDDKN